MHSAKKQKISRLTKLTFTLSNSNRATVTAEGEVPTGGWKEPELANERVGDGITHLDFDAVPPGAGTDVISAISAHKVFILGSEPREITVHSQTNEMSIALPSIGDPI